MKFNGHSSKVAHGVLDIARQNYALHTIRMKMYIPALPRNIDPSVKKKG